MWVLILEAVLAGGLFIFIVWWTMFSGRRQGERPAEFRLPDAKAGSSEPDDKPR